MAQGKGDFLDDFGCIRGDNSGAEKRAKTIAQDFNEAGFLGFNVGG